MDLLKCPRCGEEYSPSYRRCPFCEEGDHPRKIKYNSSKQSGGRRVSDKKQTQSSAARWRRCSSSCCCF